MNVSMGLLHRFWSGLLGCIAWRCMPNMAMMEGGPRFPFPFRSDGHLLAVLGAGIGRGLLVLLYSVDTGVDKRMHAYTFT